MIRFVLDFLAGALLCNAIPHLAAGLRGEVFPTPFSKPRGVGPSSPEVNFLWGALNLFLGLVLFRHHGWAAAAVGFVVMGMYASRHFGKVRGG